MYKSTEETTAKPKYPKINSWCGWDPLEEVWVGRHHVPEYFDSIKNKKIKDPLKRIAEETEEDYQALIKILKDFGVASILRPELDTSSRFGDEKPTHATTPRDHHFVYGDTLYRFEDLPYYNSLYQDYKNSGEKVFDPYQQTLDRPITDKLPAAQCVRFGDAILVDALSIDHMRWFRESFKDTKIFVSAIGGHSDGVFCPVKPGLIVTTYEYNWVFKNSIFKNWDFIYTDNNSWEQTKPIKENSVYKMLKKTQNKWYVEGEEDNDEFINFTNTYLKEWVGYCAESVFDVNMLVLDQNNVIVNSFNKKIFDSFKKYKIEPIICNLRHRWFWDGGLHCNTLDIRRKGKKERYLNF
jgi:hypothetical protein